MSVYEVAKLRRSRPLATKTAAADGRRLEADLRTRHALEDLPRNLWAVIGDLQWPGGRYGHIDHVVVGPTGVYVIDTQPWQGTVSVYGGHLRHDGQIHDGMVTQVAEAAAAIRLLTPNVPRDLVKPVIVVQGVDPVNEKIGGVRILDTASLVPALESRQNAMSSHQVSRTTELLAETLHNDQVVRVAARAGRAERRQARRPQVQRRPFPVIRVAIAVWFMATLILAPQVFTDGYGELREFIGRQVNRL